MNPVNPLKPFLGLQVMLGPPTVPEGLPQRLKGLETGPELRTRAGGFRV